MRTLFVMDAVENMQFSKDTTWSMLFVAQLRGYEVFTCHARNLYVENGLARAAVQKTEVFYNSENWVTIQDEVDVALDSFNWIFMRSDPPFDMNYITATYILSLAEQLGVAVFNNPQALRDRNEKFCIARLPQYCTDFLISCNVEQLWLFAQSLPHSVVKPLDMMGGRDIYDLHPDGFNNRTILRNITHDGSRAVMAQRYLEDIVQGDKRVFIICGQVFDTAVVRIPNPEIGRGNLDQGASVLLKPLSDRDREIAEAVVADTTASGIPFIGLDIIGDYLTEINITSPTGVRFFDTPDGDNPIMQMLFDGLQNADTATW